MEDLIVYPTVFSKATNINTEYESKLKIVLNKNEVKNYRTTFIREI
ncbi:11196_t:CDS:2 [Dentiscutata erythropus]|uniref:11196_t:CDS:1 n=1 Tax=Dentiscutata erythropus TaxID=1348616 RepID=A0A9N9G580_9GLOM|nr:11196_t:CDS:2 [Dentiscutata erythropus]